MTNDSRTNFLWALVIIAAGGGLFLLARPYLPERLFSEKATGTAIVMDSLMLEAMNTSQAGQTETLVRDSVDADTPNHKKDTEPSPDQPKTETQKRPPSEFVSVYDYDFGKELEVDSLGLKIIPLSRKQKKYNGYQHLNSFFEKLDNLEKDSISNVRIAYYGDSMVDGDLIVQDLRSALQEKFGGRGVGLVPMQSESARSRYSIKHKTTGNWKDISFMKTRSDSLDFGVNGAVFNALDSTSAVNFKASGIKHSYRLYTPKLYYGQGNDSAVVDVKNEKDTIARSLPLKDSRKLNSVLLDPSAIKSLDLSFKNAEAVPLYAVDFFDGSGITIDGFSHRGNSGMPLSLLKKGLMRQFQQELGYDLIVLHFGANVLSTSTSQFNWYARRMERVIQHLNDLFPDTPVLVMGTLDKGTKIEEEVKTDSTVVRLLGAQQRYAANTNSAFMNLFDLMGGVHSMTAWRDHKLANADYTHLSPKGSRKMGRIIYDELMKGYDEYLAFAKAEKEKSSMQATETALETKTDSINPTVND